MSYCRKGSDSDIYLIHNIYGFYECFCNPAKSFTCESPKEMFEHLIKHRDEGSLVPEQALQRLSKDIEEK